MKFLSRLDSIKFKLAISYFLVGLLGLVLLIDLVFIYLILLRQLFG